jgi:hypothetical protein
MRRLRCSTFALATLLAVGRIQAQINAVSATPDAALQPPDETTKAKDKEKEKDRFLRTLDHAQALARWMPNEPSFLAVLGRVQEQLGAAEESDLTALSEYGPHFSHLEATLARMQARMDPVQTAVEMCDPARKEELFQLYLDALDADGQREVNARICEKLASEDSSESLAQVCIGTNLVFLAARSMHDLVAVCDPSLARDAGGSAANLDQLRADLAGVQAGVQESVRVAKRDLTQAMTVVAGHVSEVSTANTTYLQDMIRSERDQSVRLEIEKALEQGKPYGALYLPVAHGGQLETVRRIVIETIQNVLASGETANGANAKVAAADEEYKSGRYKKAFRLYSQAYVAAVGTAAGEK